MQASRRPTKKASSRGESQSRQEPTLGKTAGMGKRIGRLEERIPHNGGQRGRNKITCGGPGTIGDLEITFARENLKLNNK